jgi:endo-1,4-beta-xylanase
VSTWGVTDDHSWIPSFFSGYGAALVFDEKYKPKPAFFAAIDALTRGAP